MNRNSNRYFALSNMVASHLLSNESDMPVQVIRSWFQVLLITRGRCPQMRPCVPSALCPWVRWPLKACISAIGGWPLPSSANSAYSGSLFLPSLPYLLHLLAPPLSCLANGYSYHNVCTLSTRDAGPLPGAMIQWRRRRRWKVFG